jgi:hypothetical protein
MRDPLFRLPTEADLVPYDKAIMTGAPLQSFVAFVVGAAALFMSLSV